MGAIVTPAGSLRIAVTLAAALVLLLAAFAGLLGVAVGSNACAGDSHVSPSAEADRAIPARYLTAYRAAGSHYGLPWQTLAAIGAIETDHGRSTAPGVRSGLNSYGCCAGPMQFNLTDGPPSTWQRYRVDGDHDGTKDAVKTIDKTYGHLAHDSDDYRRELLASRSGVEMASAPGQNG
jgi:hypothetical protein